MSITLPREQQEWLEGLVKAGAYSSVEEAVANILLQHMDPGIDVDDLDWAKPLVEEGLAELERGETLTLEEHRAQMEKRFGKLER